MMDRMGEVIVVTGPPGAGKSAVSKHLSSLLRPSAHVAGDVFFGFVRNGYIDPWLKEARDQNELVTEAAASAVGRLARRFHVVYDGVVGPWYLKRFLSASGLEAVHYAMLLPPLTVCLQRVATRANHGFTDLDAAEHMWRDFDPSVHGLGRHVLAAMAPPAEIAQCLARHITDGTMRYERHGADAS